MQQRSSSVTNRLPFTQAYATKIDLPARAVAITHPANKVNRVSPPILPQLAPRSRLLLRLGQSTFFALLVGALLGLMPLEAANAAPLQQLPDYGTANVVFTGFEPLEGTVILNDVTDGTDIVYQVTVRNTGTHLATNAVVTVDLPANVRLNPQPFGTDINTCTAINGAIEAPGAAFNCSLGILAPTDTNTFFVPVTIDDPTAACQAGSVTIDTANTTTFWTNTQLSNSPTGSGSANGTNAFPGGLAPVEVTVLCATDVGLQMSGPTNVILGQQLTYEMTINNNGLFPVAAGELFVDDALPTELTGAITIAGNAGTCGFVAAGGVADRYISTGALAAGASCTLSLQSSVDTAAELCSDGIIFNSATVQANGGGNIYVDQANWLTQIDCTASGDVAHDLLVSTTASSAGEVAAGQPFTFTIFVDNLGPADAAGVDLNGILFADGDFTLQSVNDSAGACVVAPASGVTLLYNCVLPELLALDRWSLTVQAVANQAISVNHNVRAYPDPQLDPDLTNNIASAYIGVADSLDLVLAMTASALSQPPNTPAVGERVYWDLVVTNNGPSHVNDVVLYDRLPAGIIAETVDISIGTDTCTIGTPGDANNPLTCNLGRLESGESRVFVISGVINPSLVTDSPYFNSGDNVINEAWVTTSSAETDNTNNRTSVSLAVAAEADLVVTKTANAATAKVGQQMGYTIVVRNNNGPSTAANVAVSDLLPEGTTFVSANVIGGRGSETCTYAGASRSVNCLLGNMLPNAEVTIDLVLAIDSDASTSLAVPTTLVNQASATSETAEADPILRNESDTATVDVTADAVLTVSQRASTSAPAPGEVIIYSISVGNQGPSTAANAGALVSLPPTVVTYLNSTLVPQCVAGIGSSLTCNLGDLAPGETIDFEITVQVDEAVADGVALNNSVQVTSDTTVLPVTATANGIVQGSADLRISQSVLPGVAAQVGLPFTYTIVVDNLGPSPSLAPVLLQELAATGNFDILSATSDAGPCVPAAGANLSEALISCTLADPVNGTLAPGTRWTIQVVAQADELLEIASDVRVSATSPIDVEPENNFDQNLIEVVGTLIDLSVNASVVPSPQALAGEPFTYTIFVDNLGPSAAIQVDLADVLLADVPVTIQSISDNLNGCSGVTTPVTGTTISLDCRVAELAQFERWTIKVVAVSQQAGTIFSEARVGGPSAADANPENNADEVSLTIRESADLAVTLAADADPVRAGAAVNYSLGVANSGPSAANNVTVVQLLPASVTVSNLPANCAPSLGGDQLSVTCTVGSLASGEAALFTIPVATDPAMTKNSLMSQASVTSDSFDGNNTNNVVSEEITVGADADLSVTIQPAKNAVVAGEGLDYAITVTNLGPSNAAEASLLQTLPAEVTLLSATISGQPGATCATANTTPPTVSCNLGDMASGDSATIVVVTVVKPDTADGTQLTSAVEVTSPTELVAIAGFIDPATKVANSQATSAPTAVSASAQLSVNKRASTDRTATGSTIHYLIEVTNDGPSVATNVVALDALPVEVDYLFDTANPTCAAGSGNERVCQLGDLAPGTSKSFEIYGRLADDIVSGTQLVNTVTVASDASPVVSASATVVVDSVADLSVRIFGTPNTTVRAGDVLSYTILVDNFGPGVAQAAQVANLITASGSYGFSGPAFCTPTSGSPAAGSQAVTCQLGAMNPNTQQQFVITLTANEEQTLQMSADVSSAASDPDLSNNSAQVAHAISAASDLVVVKNGPATVTAGEKIVYRISVNNLGPSSAQNVTVYDRLPAGVEVVTITPPAGSTCTVGTPGNGADPLACGLGTLASGTSALVIVEVSTSAGLAPETVLSNDAYASASTYDPNSDNDYSNHLTTIRTEASLAVRAEMDPSPMVIAGEGVQMRFEVTNLGPSLAQDVLLETTLPDGLLIDQMQIINHGGLCTLLPAQPQRVLCNLGAVAPDKTVQVLVTAQVDASLDAGTLLVAVAEVASSTLDPDTNDNRDTAQSTVASLAALTLNKRVSDATPQAGGETTYTLEVTNVGSSVAQDVVVIDQLPDGLSYVLSSAVCLPMLANGLDTYGCAVGDIAPGATARFEMVVSVDPDASCAAPLQNVATAQAANATESGPARASVTVDCLADLRIVNFSSADSELRAGQLVTYTFLVDNLGPGVAHRVVMTNEIVTSGLFDVVRVVADVDGRHPGASCDVGPTPDVAQRLSVTCSLPPALPFAVLDPFTGAGRWQVQVVLAADQAQTISSLAAITSADPDPDLGNNVATLQQQIVAEADLALTGTLALPTVVAGDSMTYQLRVENLGPSAASNVVLIDNLPAGVTLLSVVNPRGGCTVDSVGAAAQLRCLLGNLAADQSATVNVTVDVDPKLAENAVLAHSALVLADTLDSNQANNAIDLLSTVTRNDELIILKSATTGTAVPGQPFDYEIRVVNTGLSAVNGVDFVDTLPVGVDYLSSSMVGSQGNCIYTAGDHRLACSRESLLPNDAWKIIIHVQLDSTVADGSSVRNQIINDDPRVSPDSDLDETVVASSRADLRVDLTVSDLSPVAGEQFMVEIAVTNDGPSVARDVLVDGLLPDGVNYIQDTLDCGDTLAGCELGDLAPGSSRAFRIVAQMGRDVACGTDLLASAQVESATNDPNGGNNATGLTMTAACVADLRILHFSQSAGPVAAGEDLVYRMVVDNLGPSNAHQVTIQEQIVSDGRFDIVAINADVQGNRPSASCDLTAPAQGIRGGQTVNCALTDPLEVVGPATNQGRWVLEFTLRATEAQSFNAVATVASRDKDPDGSNNVARSGQSLTAVADLSVTTFGSPNPVVAGRTINYELTVLNEGPSTAQNVLLYNQLPAGVTLFSISPSQGSCVTGTPGNVDDRLTCGLGALAAGDNATVIVTVKVDVDMPDGTVLTNNSFVLSDVTDMNNSNNFANILTAVEARAQLRVTKVGEAGTAIAGETLAYAITVFNDGPSLAQNLIFSDLLPDDTTLVGSRVNFGSGICGYDPVGHQVDCSLAQLAAGRLHKIIIEVLVDAATDATADGGTNLINSLYWPENPTLLFHPDSDFDEVTPVETRADLAIRQSPSTLRPAAGGDFLYTIEVVNQGPSTARDVQLTEVLPAELNYLVDTLNCGPGLANCPLGDMAPDAARTIQVMVELDVATACDGVLTAVGSVTSLTTDGVAANNSASAGIAPQCGADLRIVAVGNPIGDVPAGEPLIYTLIVDNLGPGYAHDVAIVDELIADKAFEIVRIRPDVNGNRGAATCTPANPASVTASNRQSVTCDLNEALEPFKTPLLSAQSVVAAAGTESINAPLTLFGMTPGTGRWVVEIVVHGNEKLDISNIAAVSSSDPDADNNNDLVILEHGVECITYGYPDLTLTKEALPSTSGSTFGPGQDITYRLAYANNTVDPAACAAIIETVPQETYFNAIESTPGWSCLDAAPAGTLCVFDLGTVQGGESNVVEFVATVEDDVASQTVITNTAQIRMATIESLPPGTRSSANVFIDPDNTGGEENNGGEPPLTPTDLERTNEPEGLGRRIFIPLVQ